VKEEDALVAAIRAKPEEDTPRLAYADWLDERDRSGGDYLRAEVALVRATGKKVDQARRAFLKVHRTTEPQFRDRFEQPDLLRVTPTPFPTGWYGPSAASRGARGGSAVQEYGSLPNLTLAAPDDLSWIPPEPLPPESLTPDIVQHRKERLKAVGTFERKAKARHLTLPPAFGRFMRDFDLQLSVNSRRSMCQFDADWHTDYPRGDDGYFFPFFLDMNYGNDNQLAWSLYLVPKTGYHCVVVTDSAEDGELIDDMVQDWTTTRFCAPSFHAFLRRWWIESRLSRRTGRSGRNPPTPDEQAYLDHYGPPTSKARRRT
jgi:uncharacterized protein (TIGR02996 family)